MVGFNLFDFNTPEKSKQAFLNSVATPATGGGNMPPTPQTKPLARTPVVRKKQEEEEDVIQKFIDDKNIDSTKKKELGKALNEGADEAEIRTYIKQKYYNGIQEKQAIAKAQPAPVVEEKSTLKKIGGKIASSFKGGIDRIQEAGEGLSSDKYNFAEAAIRGGAGAVESALSPISGLIGQGVESGIEKLSPETKKGISDFATPAVKNVQDWYSSQSPEQQRNLDNIGVGVEMLTNIVGGKAVAKGGNAIIKNVPKPSEVLPAIEKTFTPIVKRFEDSAKAQAKIVKGTLSKEELATLESIKPKSFTPSEKEDFIKRGKLKTGKGLTGEGVEYVTDKFDEEIAKSAAKFMDPKAPVSTRVESMKKGIGQLADDTRKEIVRLGDSVFTEDAIYKKLDEIEMPIMIASDKTLETAYNLVDKKIKDLITGKDKRLSSLLDVRREFDRFVDVQFPRLYSDDKLTPMKSAILNYRSALNDFIADGLPEGNKYKPLLKEQSNLYKAIDMVAPQKDINRLGKILKNPLVKLGGTAALGAGVATYLTTSLQK